VRWSDERLVWLQASDEAIAGSDHEGGDEQTGHVDRQ
jgi:hypothetical protein